MGLEFPVDKLGSINASLALTGDNLVAAVDDGSDEWNVCSPAYERALGYIIEGHGWGFATQVVVLQPSPTAPQDQAWDTAFPVPNDLLHIIWLKINSGNPVSSTQAGLTLYDIMGTPTGPVIVCNAKGGPPPPTTPVTPAQVTCKYISSTFADVVNGSPTLVLAMQSFIMSGIYRGLHEDPQEADKMFQAAEMILQKARSRYDMQKPKRSFFNSRMAASRRIRRPWPPVGNDSWGGSNIPG